MSKVIVIACYRPKPGGEKDLLSLIKTHLPILRGKRLAGNGRGLCGKAKDGTIVEVFSWKSQAAIDAAQEITAVTKMWGAIAEVCDYVTIKDVEGAGDLFTPLEPVDLS